MVFVDVKFFKPEWLREFEKKMNERIFGERELGYPNFVGTLVLAARPSGSGQTFALGVVDQCDQFPQLCFFPSPLGILKKEILPLLEKRIEIFNELCILCDTGELAGWAPIHVLELVTELKRVGGWEKEYQEFVDRAITDIPRYPDLE